MARHRPESDDDVSLFPFLSILACVIGTLTLMISGLALGQMEDKSFVNIEKYNLAKMQLDVLKSQIEELKKKIEQKRKENQKNLLTSESELKKLMDQLNQKQDEIKKLKAENALALADRKTIKVPDISDIAKVLEEMKEQLKTKEEQVAQLDKMIKQRKLPPREGNVTVLPGGSGKDIDPVFVECAESSIVIHEGPRPIRIRTAEVSKDKRFIKLVSDIAKSKNKSMIFLLRNDGLSTYHTVRGYARRLNARTGKLPVLGKGRIDLSEFNRLKNKK